MKREQKNQIIAELTEQFARIPNFYFTDTTSMTVEQVNKLRRMAYEKGVKIKVAKNTLIKKALEANNINTEELMPALKGQTALLFSEVANEPARLLKAFRKDKGVPKLKGAYIESAIYIGDNHLEALSNIKSKAELIGEVIALLQAPARNVIGALQSGGQKLAGIIKTLGDKKE